MLVVGDVSKENIFAQVRGLQSLIFISIRLELFLEMVKCGVLNDIEQRAACSKDAEGSSFFYLPIIIIVTVVIIIATVIIGFAVKTLAKHFHDNGVHHLDDTLRSPR